MESIEQPIFNPYASDDKEELIDGPTGVASAPSAAENQNSNNTNSDTSPVLAAKGLLSSEKEALDNQNRGLLVIIICTTVFAVIITIALIMTIYLLPKQVNGHAAVVTEVPACSDVGLSMISKGGNAIDAAVAAAFCLGVYHPQSSGLGGGGFLLYHDHKNGDSVAYDFRETAPEQAFSIMLDRVDNVEYSGLAVGVPGELKGLETVHKEWGKLEWADVVQPAIDIAKRGFNVTQNLASSLRNHVNWTHVPADSLLTQFKKLKAGDFIKRLKLAKTLQLIQDEGAAAFYDGILGQNFVTMLAEHGGKMDTLDLKDYTVLRKDPILSSFKEFQVIGMPAPSSGPVVALVLNMMEGFNWTTKNISSPLMYKQMVETFKFGFGHRTLLGDPANKNFADDIENSTADCLSKEYAAKLRAKVDEASHDAKHYGAVAPPSIDQGTTHVSVIDPGEVMISLTLTNNYWFGSKLMTEDGILANNEMMDFDHNHPVHAPKNERNRIVPGMRPLSSMVPTVVHNADHPCGKRIIIGGSNGTRIITGVVESLINALLLDMNIQEAVACPRLHQQLQPEDITEIEGITNLDAPNATATTMAQSMYQVGNTRVVDQGMGAVEAIMKINDKIQAYSDWRKGGKASTF